MDATVVKVPNVKLVSVEVTTPVAQIAQVPNSQRWAYVLKMLNAHQVTVQGIIHANQSVLRSKIMVLIMMDVIVKVLMSV